MPGRLLRIAAAASALACAGCREMVSDPLPAEVCVAEGRALRAAYYASFAPVSHRDEGGAHRGFEADLLSALEAMDGAHLSFARSPVEAWANIWLLSSTPDFDLSTGGITILESRTRDSDGMTAVAFTSGHIAFRQSLLVRAADAQRLSSYDRLTSEVRVGALPGTTGEARFLVITGITSADGVLRAGTRVETHQGTVVADGTASYVITAANTSASLADRTRLVPPSDDLPVVVYLGRTRGEAELLDALRAGTIDAVARGEIGNGEAAHASNGALVVAALDTLAEYGGFTLDADEPALLACIDEKIDFLTNDRAIGYAEWRADPEVFAKRAATWRPGG